VYLVNHKSELVDKFKVYKIEVENQIERKNKILRSHRGGEFTSLDMVNAMLVSFGLPKNMWGEVLYSACHILYRVPL